jgi:hypothetical protein
MSISTKQRLTKILKRTGQVLATFINSLMIYFSGFFAVNNLIDGTGSAPAYVHILLVIVFILCIVMVWREETPGAILLLVVSGGLSLYLEGIGYNFYAWLILGTPFVLAGILLFIAGILPKEKQIA